METSHIWDILKSMFEKGLIHHHIDSYNEFIHNDIARIINEETKIKIPLEDGSFYIVAMENVYLPPASIIENRNITPITPDDARIRDLTYETSLHVDITEAWVKDKTIIRTETHRRVVIAKIPVMLKSCLCNLTTMSKSETIQANECIYDNGGYFIIKGKERVLISQCRGIYNKVMVIPQNTQKKTNNKYSYIAEMRSMSAETGHSVLIKACFGVDEKTIIFSLPYITSPIPAGIVFKALGFTQEADITHLLNIPQKYVNIIIRDSNCVKTQESALEYIGEHVMHTLIKEKKSVYAKQVVEVELFPHMGITSTNKEKAFLLGHIIKCLLQVVTGEKDVDDRDNYSNKRLEPSGILLEELFRTLFKRYIKNMIITLEKRQDIIFHINRITSSISQGLRQCFATGNWGVQKNSYVRTGVSQVLSRMSYGATLSHLRRMNLPVGKEGKNAKIRQIHASQFGFICPSETPEGQTAGIVLNFALSTRITKHIPTYLVRDIISKIKYLIPIDDCVLSNSIHLSKVFLNGVIIGFVENARKFVRKVQLYKLHSLLPYSVSVSISFSDVYIYSDKGRFIRPLFTVEEGKLKIVDNQSSMDWDELVDKDYIRYVDNTEIEMSNIAMTPQEITLNTHFCEIHPCLILGVCASIIPFPANSQSPRLCYESSMCKQAISMYALTFNTRTDTAAHVLHYPQKQLVKTKPSELMGFDDMPSGINAIVAIACYTGRNQEDSIILNKAAVDRGMFVATTYKTITIEEKKRSTYVSEIIEIPDHSIRHKTYNYSMLDQNGIIKKGVYVKKGDVIVGKVAIKTSKTGEEEKNDCSHVLKAGEDGIVDRIYIKETPNEYKIVKIVLRQIRIPEIGDKLASKTGQKGTIGCIMPAEDMPFTSNGLCPDLIINSHCLTGDTMIQLSTGQYKPIKDIYLNTDTLIATIDPVTLEKTFTTFKYGFKKTPDHCLYIIKTIAKNEIKCTGDHKFLIIRNKKIVWMPCKDIKPTLDLIIIYNTCYSVTLITEITPLSDIEPVYDFTTVSENHSFIANGFVSHNCIPSRMTINQLLECVLGKVGVITGKFGNATPFEEDTINIADRICSELSRLGFQSEGKEAMYCGITGEMMEASIFIGPTYYQRLKHMVSDKIHSRATGSITMLAHQPGEGRSVDGGLRIGEMEKDSIVVQGASKFLKERLFDMSDPYQITVCDKCGQITKSMTECTDCNDDTVSRVNTPYAAKLLFTELQAMGIKIVITPDE